MTTNAPKFDLKASRSARTGFGFYVRNHAGAPLSHLNCAANRRWFEAAQIIGVDETALRVLWAGWSARVSAKFHAERKAKADAATDPKVKAKLSQRVPFVTDMLNSYTSLVALECAKALAAERERCGPEVTGEGAQDVAA